MDDSQGPPWGPVSQEDRVWVTLRQNPRRVLRPNPLSCHVLLAHFLPHLHMHICPILHLYNVYFAAQGPYSTRITDEDLPGIGWYFLTPKSHNSRYCSCFQGLQQPCTCSGAIWSPRTRWNCRILQDVQKLGTLLQRLEEREACGMQIHLVGVKWWDWPMMIGSFVKHDWRGWVN